MELDFHLRLPYPRSGCDRRAGTRLHAGNGFTYVERGIARGLDVDRFAPRLSFFWDVHNEFFEEIAKLRAARRIWARHLRDRYGARDERSLKMRFHCQTAGVSLTAQQPMNNVARVAYQALAAVLGGTQSLHTNALDETLALPTELSVRVALRTQQILAYETGVASVADPLGGSYLVEALTEQPRSGGRGDFRPRRCDGRHGGGHRGGLVSAGDRPIGVALPVGGRGGRAHDRRPQCVCRRGRGADRNSQDRRGRRAPAAAAHGRDARTSRSGRSSPHGLHALRAAAVNDTNIIPAMLDCARAYCTLFEIRHVLEAGLGRVPRTGVFLAGEETRWRGRSRSGVAASGRVAHEAGGDPVVSCYLKLEPRDRARRKYLTKAKNRVKDLEYALPSMGWDRRSQDLIRADLARVVDLSVRREDACPTAQGLAVFASSAA